MSHIAVIAAFIPIPEHRQRVASLLDEMIAPTRAEPGCLQYDLYADEDGFQLFERYCDSEAIDAHRATDHYASYRSSIAGLLASPISVTVTHPVDVE